MSCAGASIFTRGLSGRRGNQSKTLGSCKRRCRRGWGRGAASRASWYATPGIQSELPMFGDGIPCSIKAVSRTNLRLGFVARLRCTLQQPFAAKCEYPPFERETAISAAYEKSIHHIVLTMATHPQNHIYEEYTLLHPPLTSIPAVVKHLCLQRDAFINTACTACSLNGL